MRLRRRWPKLPYLNVPAAPILPALTQPGIRIDLYESDGVTRVAAGPVLNALQCAYGETPSGLGGFTFQIALNDRMAAECATGRIVQIFVGGEGYTFQGRIETARDIPGDRGVKEISGRSVAVELAKLSTRFGLTFSESDSIATVVGLFLAGTSWTAGSLEAPPLTSYSRAIVGVKRYPGLLKVADLFGWLVRTDSRTRKVDLGALGETSGLRFTNWEGPISPRLRENAAVVLLQGCQQTQDIATVVKRVIAVGQENGISGDRVTLELATEGPPFVQSAADYDGNDFHYIEDSDPTNDGTEDVIVVKDIVPLTLSTADKIRAANALWGAAKTYLDRRSQPLRTFSISPVGLRHIVDGVDTFRVGQKARVQWRGWDRDRRGQKRQYIDIDEDLWLMGYWRTIMADGRSDWSLTVSNVPREVPSETQQLVDLYERFDASVAAPRSEFRWGGIPPIGSLTPAGIQILSDFGQQAGFWFVPEITVAPNLEDLYGFLRGSAIPDFAGEPYSDVQLGARSQNGTEDTQITATLSADGFGNPQLHIQGLTTLDGGVTGDLYYLYDATQQKFILTIDGQNVGGAMKSANTGPYLIPTLGTGGAVRSGNGAYGSYAALALADISAPAAPTVTTFAAAVSHNVTMPGTVNAGDLLIVLLATVGATNPATPSGWASVGTQVNGTNSHISVFSKTADGTEDGTTVDFTVAGGSVGAAHVYRIPAGSWDTGASVAISTGTTAAGNPDPGAVTPTQVGRFIAIACAAEQSGIGSFNTAHGGYSGFTESHNGTGAADIAIVSSYSTGLNTNTENPGAYSGGSITNSAAFTIAIMASAAVAEAAYITGVDVAVSGTPGYLQIQLATGAIGAESVIGTFKLNTADPTLEFPAIIPVSAAARISARIATDAAAANHNVTLHVINQDDVQ